MYLKTDFKIQSAGIGSASEQFSLGVKRSGLNFGKLTLQAGWGMKLRGVLKQGLMSLASSREDAGEDEALAAGLGKKRWS